MKRVYRVLFSSGRQTSIRAKSLDAVIVTIAKTCRLGEGDEFKVFPPDGAPVAIRKDCRQAGGLYPGFKLL